MRPALPILLILLTFAGSGLAEARDQRSSGRGQADCARQQARCSGDVRPGTRQGYSRDTRQQGDGQYIYRGQRRIWAPGNR